MKYVKKYESLFFKYNIGDYVLLKTPPFGEDSFAKIVDRPSDAQEFRSYTIGTTSWFGKDKTGAFYPYKIEFANGTEIKIDKKNIERLLTEDEIEEYEAEKTGIKYNL
jgi:hypothetical protein